MTNIMENELNTATGGSMYQTSVDSQALHFKGFMDEEFSFTDLLFHWCTDSAKVDAGWAKAGITCVSDPWDSNNRYYRSNKRISRRTALKTIGIL